MRRLLPPSTKARGGPRSGMRRAPIVVARSTESPSCGRKRERDIVPGSGSFGSSDERAIHRMDGAKAMIACTLVVIVVASRFVAGEYGTSMFCAMLDGFAVAVVVRGLCARLV